MTMKSRLVDPIHFFDARGRSVLTNEHQARRIVELEQENAKIKRLLKSQVLVNRQAETAEAKSTLH